VYIEICNLNPNLIFAGLSAKATKNMTHLAVGVFPDAFRILASSAEFKYMKTTEVSLQGERNSRKTKRNMFTVKMLHNTS
jgi:hypothetical protein